MGWLAGVGEGVGDGWRGLLRGVEGVGEEAGRG